MKATERLARRLESERARGERFKARRMDEGKRQLMVWLADDDVERLDRIKAMMGAANRAEVISALVKERQP